MKEYQKPELEVIAFLTREAITDEQDGLTGGMGLTSNPFLAEE